MIVQPVVCSVDNISKIWDWCVESYLRYGRKLSFPKHTDPIKTYQWRYLTAIAKKFDEWNFDDETARRFIDIAAQQSKQAGTMVKGLAALHQSNMMQLCYDKLQDKLHYDQRTIEALSHTHAWVIDKITNHPTCALLFRASGGSFCNLTLWYQASKLTPLYLALSRPCQKALLKLSDVDERTLLPTHAELYLARTEFLCDRYNLLKSKEVLGADFYKGI